MSDEPKKRSRAWLSAAWALIAVFALYPLSVGHSTWILMKSGSDQRLATTYQIVYLPLSSLCQASDTARSLVSWYVRLWVPRR